MIELRIICGIDATNIPLDNEGQPVMSEKENRMDAMDAFNHPRLRRALIVLAMQRQEMPAQVQWTVPSTSASTQKLVDMYHIIHTDRLLDFLLQAWSRWVNMGQEGQDPLGYAKHAAQVIPGTVPPLTPPFMPLPRDSIVQKPSRHVVGQMGFFCTDNATPIFDDLVTEMSSDTAVLTQAVETATAHPHAVVYAMPIHPGHHASADSFGGYCYVNHAAAAVRHLQKKLAEGGEKGTIKVAVLDVDYHCGNGTASIFYDDPSVMVVSLHCDPDYDYPFHSGFADETGVGDGVGTTLHLPMLPGAKWQTEYQQALARGVQAIRDFGPQALIVSLGLDTLDKDPCTFRRAGFCLFGQDYVDMGAMIAGTLPVVPTIIFQEGGYRMECIGQAASDVVRGFCQGRAQHT